jgi:hypothetical protein
MDDDSSKVDDRHLISGLRFKIKSSEDSKFANEWFLIHRQQRSDFPFGEDNVEFRSIYHDIRDMSSSQWEFEWTLRSFRHSPNFDSKTPNRSEKPQRWRLFHKL